MAQEHYKQVKNYLNNEYKLDEKIGKTIEHTIEKLTKDHLERYFESHAFKRLMKDTLSAILSGYTDYSRSFHNVQEHAVKRIQAEVKDGINKHILSKLNVEVTIKNDQPDA